MREVKKQYNILDRIERIGNKIPHPFILFFILTIVVILISGLGKVFGLEAINPVTKEVIKIRSLMSGEGLIYILENMIKNFVNFSPLGLVVVMTLGIGLIEEVGMISTFVKTIVKNTSSKKVTFIIMLIGICGNLASDISTVIIPSIAGVVYLSLGRHPLVGIAVGYVATTAGFSANLFIAGTDALLAGISTEAIKSINPNLEVSILGNWYFMIASTFVLALVGSFVTEKIIEPRLGKYSGKKIINNEEVSYLEKKALKISGLFMGLYSLIILGLVLPKDSILRNTETQSLINSPFLRMIVPLLLILFLIGGITYGKIVGKIKKSGDIPKFMSQGIKNISSYIVLVFMIGQFIACFNWTKLGYILAMKGAIWLQSINLKGLPLFIMFVLVIAFINLFIGSGSAKWGMLAPIFVPMFYILGYNPSLTQLLYRIGDSTTNIITPLAPYLGIIIKLAREYDEDCGVGTIISLMVPYTIGMLVAWIGLAIIWISLNIPLGPHTSIFI